MSLKNGASGASRLTVASTSSSLALKTEQLELVLHHAIGRMPQQPYTQGEEMSAFVVPPTPKSAKIPVIIAEELGHALKAYTCGARRPIRLAFCLSEKWLWIRMPCCLSQAMASDDAARLRLRNSAYPRIVALVANVAGHAPDRRTEPYWNALPDNP
jgi:hypothetical protein